jgi:hypothetical protein
MQDPCKRKLDPFVEEAKRKLRRLRAEGKWPPSSRSEQRPRIKKRESTFDYIPSEQMRLISCHTLLRGLFEEIEKGNSLSKLYASLLAKTMLESDSKLKSKYQQRLMSLTAE